MVLITMHLDGTLIFKIQFCVHHAGNIFYDYDHDYDHDHDHNGGGRGGYDMIMMIILMMMVMMTATIIVCTGALWYIEAIS